MHLLQYYLCNKGVLMIYIFPIQLYPISGLLIVKILVIYNHAKLLEIYNFFHYEQAFYT